MAREVHIGGIAVENADFTVKYTDKKVNDAVFTTVFRTEIINIDNMEITGTKTWVDNGNAYGTRPGDLTLTLWRTTTPDDDASIDIRIGRDACLAEARRRWQRVDLHL